MKIIGKGISLYPFRGSFEFPASDDGVTPTLE